MFSEGDLLSMTSNRWRTVYRILKVDSAHTLTIKWAWWLEVWLQRNVIGLIWGIAVGVWLAKL